VDYFPVFMDLRARRCVVVGGGEVAARKASLVLRAEAQVTVVAPALCESLRLKREAGAFAHHARPYEPADLDRAVLVIAATNDREVNRAVSRDAQARQLPVNVVDDPELCSVIVPALVEREPILIAIGTGGSAPVLARLLRGRIEAHVPSAYGDLAALSAALRGEVQARLPDVNARRRFWEEVLEGDIAERVLRGERAQAEQLLRAKLAANSGEISAQTGEIFLIGVGPNDPELLSFKALRLLQRSDLVVLAPAVSERIAELARRDATPLHLVRWPPADDDVGLQRVAAAVSAGQRACVLAQGDAFREPDGIRLRERLEALRLPCIVIPGIASTQPLP
jgi:uroporphyrin-III C-methyltransferase/precorrin-2 dehydrogenase/sirohydrochlorin ferrochelatase